MRGSTRATRDFYDLRNWTDVDWQRARDSIKAQDAKDRADR